MYADKVEKSTVLPSFSQAFDARMSTRLQRNQSKNAEISDKVYCASKHETLKARDHPKKTALKRHLHELELEKVVVQPSQPDNHFAKRLKSDWDLLFYNNHDNQSDDGRSNGGNRGLLERVQSPTVQKTKRRQSFLVKGKEMKCFFHLTGRLR